MPTIEERLAALETKLAALTETTPTTYYEHQYSGEEIDAAVGRALTGGALDTSVTNVSNQLGTFTRPNLLDNWYFGRPVDQKGGYIVPKGVNYYKVDGFVPQGPIPETVKVDHIDSAGSAIFNYGGVICFVPKDGGYVRGYTGAFVYTIDRWQLGDGSISLSVAADGIVLNGGNNANTDYIYTRVERLPVGKYTFSVLFADNTANVVLTTRLTDISVVPAVESREASGVLALTWDQPEEFTADYAYFRIHIPGSAKILAVKLEIGPTQTLAHREGDRWVLNEVPEYGEQLRRCQRYCVDITPSLTFNTMYSGFLSTTGCDFLVPIPVTLRESGAAPVVICNPAEWQVAVPAANEYFTPTSINVSQTASGAVMLRCLFSNSLPGQYCDLRKAVDSAKLILSKDL